MDRPAIHAAEAFVQVGYPLDVEALLIVELDGPPAEIDHLIAKVETIARDHRATTIRVSRDDAERLAFWSGRKAAFPAVGRISPDYYCMDGTIPRGRLAQVLSRMREVSERYRLGVANVFHAGDGNLHPLILYDANKPGEIGRRAEAVRLRYSPAVRGSRRGVDRRARRRRRKARPDGHDVRRNRLGPSAARQMRVRPRRPLKPRQGLSRNCTAAPNWAACTCAPGNCPSPTCRGFKGRWQERSATHRMWWIVLGDDGFRVAQPILQGRPRLPDREIASPRAQ